MADIFNWRVEIEKSAKSMMLVIRSNPWETLSSIAQHLDVSTTGNRLMLIKRIARKLNITTEAPWQVLLHLIRVEIEKQDEYIKVGLAVYYDGYNNTGNGHSTTATKWIDLSGNNRHGVLFNNGTTWNTDSIKIGENGGVKITNMPNYTGPLTIEAVSVSYETATCYVVRSAASSSNPSITFQNCIWYTGNSLSARSSVSTLGALSVVCKKGYKNYAAMRLDDLNKTFNYDIGSQLSSLKNEESYPTTFGDAWYVGNRHEAATDRSLLGNVYAVRIYFRYLSDEEITLNHKIDVKRFGLHNQISSAIFMTSTSTAELED